MRPQILIKMDKNERYDTAGQILHWHIKFNHTRKLTHIQKTEMKTDTRLKKYSKCLDRVFEYFTGSYYSLCRDRKKCSLTYCFTLFLTTSFTVGIKP